MRVNASLRKARLKTKGTNGHVSTRPRTRPRPIVALAPPGSLEHCLKCQGWIVVQMVDLSKKLEMRCLNCGWQPQYGERVIRETEEARSIRRFTAEMFAGAARDKPTTPLEESFERIDFSKRSKRS